MVGNGSGELITPLVPSTQPAGSLQQFPYSERYFSRNVEEAQRRSLCVGSFPLTVTVTTMVDNGFRV